MFAKMINCAIALMFVLLLHSVKANAAPLRIAYSAISGAMSARPNGA